MMETNPMQGLIDKLCDHLSVQRVKLLIQNGFDDWETVALLKGPELIELQYSSEECIIIMVAVNAHAKELGEKEVFLEEAMKEVLAAAKEKEGELKARIEQEEIEKRMGSVKLKDEKVEQIEELNEAKQYPMKAINEAVLLKGVALKGKERVPLNKITLMSLEEKELTHISELQRAPGLLNLYLGRNHILEMRNLQHLKRLKILKLESNELSRIQGLEGLQELEQLFLNDNHITKLEGLTSNRRLQLVNISQQRSKRPLQFDEECCEALAYTLETLISDGNRINSILALRHLKVLNTLSLKNNALAEMGDLSEPLGALERLKTLDCRGNSLCALPKYRDYMVILSKNLEQLDTKQILPKEREYLVKLYSLKHAKQMREQETQGKKAPVRRQELQVTKLSEGTGQYAHNSDLRGNVVYANTKVQRK